MTNEDATRHAMRRNCWIVAILGILMPYLARLPGIPEHGWSWLISYFGDNWMAPLFFGAFNAVCWVPVIIGSKLYKQPSSIWYPAVGAWPVRRLCTLLWIWQLMHKRPLHCLSYPF